MSGTMIDCGKYTFDAWQRNQPHITRWLGPFDVNMPCAEVQRRLEHDKLTDEANRLFELGFEEARKAFLSK